ncbi:hypothetical protein NN561_001549 [Cricetulus griseus]
MGKIALQLKATLENVTNLRPLGEDFLKMKCGNCGLDAHGQLPAGTGTQHRAGALRTRRWAALPRDCMDRPEELLEKPNKGLVVSTLSAFQHKLQLQPHKQVRECLLPLLLNDCKINALEYNMSTPLIRAVHRFSFTN